MDTITLDSLHENLTFTGDLMIDGTFVLLPQTAPVTNELIKALKEWEFDSFYCEGNLSLGGDIGISVSTGTDDQSNDKNAPKIGESLRTNSTLTLLNLNCEALRNVFCWKKKKCFVSGCRIGDEGAIEIGESLKTNRSLTKLNLTGETVILRQKKKQ